MQIDRQKFFHLNLNEERGKKERKGNRVACAKG